MAGDWIKIATDLPEKPEVWQMAGSLGIDADSVVGKLIKVWRWFDSHTEDGNAFGVTYTLVDHVSGVTGFGEAMALCGWLNQDGMVLSLPHFDRHNGETAKKRALTAKRVAKYKAKGNDACVTTALPREEKRREEIKDITTLSSSKDDLLPPKQDQVPYTSILDAYHQHLPMLPQVRKLNETRKRKVRARWKEDKERQNIEYWKGFFQYVAGSDFLTGRNGQWHGCDFEWLVNDTNHLKVIEGKYENRDPIYTTGQQFERSRSNGHG